VHNSLPPNTSPVTPLTRGQNTVKAISLVLLAGLTATGFAVSYTRLHDFMARFGETGWTAYATAAMVDTLTLAGLLVALVFLSGWARIAFILGLGFTGFANAFIGYQVAGAFGLVVGLVPIISMELSYRTALSLMFGSSTTPQPPTGPSNPTPTPPTKSGGLWRKLSKPLEKPQEPSKEPSTPLEELTPTLNQSKLDTATISKALLESGDPLPSRKEVMKTYRVSEWTARQALQQARNNAAA